MTTRAPRSSSAANARGEMNRPPQARRVFGFNEGYGRPLVGGVPQARRARLLHLGLARRLGGGSGRLGSLGGVYAATRIGCAMWPRLAAPPLAPAGRRWARRGAASWAGAQTAPRPPAGSPTISSTAAPRLGLMAASARSGRSPGALVRRARGASSRGERADLRGRPRLGRRDEPGALPPAQTCSGAQISEKVRKTGRVTARFEVRIASKPWARLVSNQRPLACEASALPLSYAPCPLIIGSRLPPSRAAIGTRPRGYGGYFTRPRSDTDG